MEFQPTKQGSPLYRSPICTPTLTNPSQFSKQLKHPLSQIANLTEQIQINKYTNHKKLLSEIHNLEKSLLNNLDIKKSNYNKILNQLSLIQAHIEEQKITAQRNLLNLEIYISQVSKQCQKKFEKINKERAQSERKINKIIQERLDILPYRNKIVLGIHNSEQNQLSSLVPYNQYLEQLLHIKAQVKTYYEKLNHQQQKLTNQFNTTIQQYKIMLKQQIQSQEGSQNNHIIQYMKNLHIEISQKIKQMAKDRSDLQENLLKMLDNVISGYFTKNNL